MEFVLYKLQFKAPLHISSGLEDNLSQSERVIHSDTLKSAIFAVGYQLHSEWKSDDLGFWQSVRLSSCFPFFRSHLFFPKPMKNLGMQMNSVDSASLGKTRKRILYLEKNLFEAEINSEEKEIETKGSFAFLSSSNSALIDFREVYVSNVQQRVSKSHTEDGNPVPYFIDRVYFDQEGGLFFLAQFENEDIRQPFEQALKFLGEQGVGSDRNVGNGQFDVLPAERITLKQPTNPNAWLNLSLYLPTEPEWRSFDLSKSYWQLIKRGGYISSSPNEAALSLRKKSVFMIREGSVLSNEIRPAGSIRDISPQFNPPIHPVYRDGMALFIPILSL